ncbi:MAG: YHS domain-containing (seleno)protein [Kiloniellales bacterium]
MNISIGRAWRLVLVLVAGLAGSALATQTALAKGFVNVDKSGVAIGGYDPVAYFEGAPMKGEAQYATEWQGATWHFAGAANRDAFLAEPEKFAPQYGGWCAYGAAKGYAAEVDPADAWTVHDGKLYLNWSAGVKRQWSNDIPGYLAQSEANWPAIKAGLADGTGKISRK